MSDHATHTHKHRHRLVYKHAQTGPYHHVLSEWEGCHHCSKTPLQFHRKWTPDFPDLVHFSIGIFHRFLSSQAPNNWATSETETWKFEWKFKTFLFQIQKQDKRALWLCATCRRACVDIFTDIALVVRTFSFLLYFLQWLQHYLNGVCLFVCVHAHIFLCLCTLVGHNCSAWCRELRRNVNVGQSRDRNDMM